MKRIKAQKGITLIALIITIVVLLILTVVAIREVQGDGIIAKAREATNKYNDKKAEEEDILSGYELQLAQASGNAWKQEGTVVNKGELRLEIGDTTNYTAGGYTWKVLGEENGHILLITDEYVTENFNLTCTAEDWDSNTHNMPGVINKLDNECVKKVLTEKNLTLEDIQATKVRSVKATDLNRITGYNPSSYSNYSGIQFGKQYTYNTDNLEIDPNYGYINFKLPDGRILGENNFMEFISTQSDYRYTIKESDLSSKAYEMISKKSGEYWLGDCSNDINLYNERFNTFTISNNTIDSIELWNTSYGDGQPNWWSKSVRAVVSLSLDANIEVVE